MTNTLTSDQVKHVAKLASLNLTDQELADFKEKLSATLNYIGELSQVDTSNVEPTSQVTGKTNELREDEVKPGFTQEEALANAKSHNGFFLSKVSWN